MLISLNIALHDMLERLAAREHQSLLLRSLIEDPHLHPGSLVAASSLSLADACRKLGRALGHWSSVETSRQDDVSANARLMNPSALEGPGPKC